jgi:hypothetical protein
LTLLFLITINSFAQEIDSSDFLHGNSKQNNAIIIDLFPMVPGANGYEFGEGIGFGIMYERKIHPYFSILGKGTFSTNFTDKLSYGFSPHFRFYPLKTAIKNLFTDISIVYSRNIAEEEDIQTLSGVISVGWNFILWKGLVLEPGVFYRHKFIDITGVKPYNFGFGFIIGIGWAF